MDMIKLNGCFTLLANETSHRLRAFSPTHVCVRCKTLAESLASIIHSLPHKKKSLFAFDGCLNFCLSVVTSFDELEEASLAPVWWGVIPQDSINERANDMRILRWFLSSRSSSSCSHSCRDSSPRCLYKRTNFLSKTQRTNGHSQRLVRARRPECVANAAQRWMFSGNRSESQQVELRLSHWNTFAANTNRSRDQLFFYFSFTSYWTSLGHELKLLGCSVFFVIFLLCLSF